MKVGLFTALFCITVMVSPAQKQLLYSNATYEPQIRTVQLVAETELALTFDDLREQQEYYYYKLIHCNYDWKKSSLFDLDFMQDYNEFRINDISYSTNVGQPYVHYRFAIPNVKIPGNYLIIVYRNGNEKDLILSHRLIVPDNQLKLQTTNQLAGTGNLFTSNQQMNFTLGYGGVEINNPLGTVHVVILQNHRWDNARYDVTPSFVREDRSELEYRFFDQDNQFRAGNEFRFVDFRSLNFPGQNTGSIDKNVNPYLLTVQQDRPRTSLAYAQYADMNGDFILQNLDQRGDATLSANYINVQFTLTAPAPAKENVYVVGAFNNWARTQENQMTYHESQKAYQTTLLLKQGRYDYQYVAEGDNTSLNYFEGNHFQTENMYEILVYYRPFRPNADLLIGYFNVPVNPR